MHSRSYSCLLAAVAATAVACGPPWALRHDAPHGTPPPLAFLQSPQATLGDAVHELGPPSRQFPRDRVSLWELTIDGERLLPVARSRTPERIGDFMLVVSFDRRGQVAQWSLVRQSTLLQVRP